MMARVYRVEPVTAVPSPFIYCMFCGKVAEAHIDTETDTYEIWARELDLDQSIVKMLYDAWPANSYARFFDFARAAIEDPSIL
jgi:hypothetical protein